MGVIMDTIKNKKYKTYRCPEMKVLGKVKDLTHSGDAGTALDVNFPAGTSLDDLTFYYG